MAVRASGSETDNRTHTEKMAEKHPEKMREMAERTSGEFSAYLERCLERASN